MRSDAEAHMYIRVAGYNVDVDELAKVADAGRAVGAVLTPETLSAAYARISKHDVDVDELRRRSVEDVDRSRTSNEAIVFEQGHASIAEHAVFNVDVKGISRLAIEELEAQRIASYTEKSQRYVRLGEDYVVPEELPEALRRAFAEGVRGSLSAHGAIVERLRDYWRALDPVPDDPEERTAWRRRRRERIREDARYAATLAATGQLGMTLNARAVEAASRRMMASPLAEVRGVATALVQEVRRIAPSLIRYTDATPVEAWKRGTASGPATGGAGPAEAVRLVDPPADGDLQVAAACLVERVGGSYGGALTAVRADPGIAGDLLVDLRGRTGMHDPMPRGFEMVRLDFDLVCSASCFAQLKRHRIATVIPGPYDPGLGITTPPHLADAGARGILQDSAAAAEELYRRIVSEVSPAHAAYALTNAHRRRVLFSCHLRELVHLSRLRMDAHAQWDIRALAAEMCRQVRAVMPLAGAFLAGKDDWGASA
ncbi:MAG: FAD-dependent thymidylate synthase [Pseudomonadota bacterium]